MDTSSANRCRCSRELRRNSGEHRLPACESRQLAETSLRFSDAKTACVAGKLPATAGWQPALPRTSAITFLYELLRALFERRGFAAKKRERFSGKM
jgi:hypothetical protein